MTLPTNQPDWQTLPITPLIERLHLRWWVSNQTASLSTLISGNAADERYGR
jgi:hypothetical protein